MGVLTPRRRAEDLTGGLAGGPVSPELWQAWPLSDRQRSKLLSVQRSETELYVLSIDAQSTVTFTVPPRINKHGELTATKSGKVTKLGKLTWTRF